jgi:hypothetical protein
MKFGEGIRICSFEHYINHALAVLFCRRPNLPHGVLTPLFATIKEANVYGGLL